MGQKDLPVASGEKHAAAFVRLGWTRSPRRGRGTHILLTKPGHPATLAIPDHTEVKRALLAKLLKVAGVTEAEYVGNFKR